jgi:thiol-disulfide isomerase/thioredoxin
MKKVLLTLIIVTLIASCKRNDSFVVNGHLSRTDQKYISISKVDVNFTSVLDSSKISRSGKFKFRIKARETDFYQVGSSRDFITLLASPGEKINLEFPGNNLYNSYSVIGSKGSEQIRDLDLRLINTKTSIDSLNQLYDQASKEPDFETKKGPLENEYLRIIKAQRKFNITFIIQNTTSLATIKALYQKINDNTYVLYDAHDLQYLKIASDSLKKYYPESKHTKALLNDFSKELNQFYSNKLTQITKNLPEAKLDPSLKDISGKRITLSSFKGKYVLLGFWSSEVKDCIIENLQLKEFYKRYHPKGFEIYQINLDADEATWRAAVKFDDLQWINTREDDPANPKNVRLFDVRTLPTNYLFDKNGRIIASNLHGKNLQLKLEQLFSN